MNPEHFEHWVIVFTTTVDELFEGVKAIEIKDRALNIANVIMYKTLA
jgi:hemoglobin